MSGKDGEDAFHRLPHPMPWRPPGSAPFVGNASLDDNIAENVQVALWSAIGDDHHRIRIAVEEGVVTLSGTLPDRAMGAAALAAARAVSGVRDVVSALGFAGRRRTAGRAGAVHEPMLYVTRYCGLDAPSLRAAVADGLGVLDAFLRDRGLPAGSDLLVIFRNRRPDTLTIDIGVPVASDVAARAAGEVHAGEVPGGAMTSVLPDPGVQGLLAALSRLEPAPHEEGRGPGNWAWQRIAGGARRQPWQGPVATPINTPAAAAARPHKESGS